MNRSDLSYLDKCLVETIESLNTAKCAVCYGSFKLEKVEEVTEWFGVNAIHTTFGSCCQGAPVQMFFHKDTLVKGFFKEKTNR